MSVKHRGRGSQAWNRRVGLRIAFAALLLVLPVQLAVRNAISDEPYPGLFLPNFGPVPEQAGSVEFQTRSVTAELTDDTVIVLDGGELLTGSGGGALPFTRLLSDPAHVDEKTVKWLGERLRVVYPRLDVQSLSIVANSWKFDESTGERSLRGTHVLNRIEIGGTE
ncbi:hypothetical protein [Microbacterium deminutum]|uniref:Uncharacterized protein n=1 Tax=Microbacterium deminutum TaxID=344164 RepID=A0ABN2R9I0_9MICO